MRLLEPINHAGKFLGCSFALNKDLKTPPPSLLLGTKISDEPQEGKEEEADAVEDGKEEEEGVEEDGKEDEKEKDKAVKKKGKKTVPVEADGEDGGTVQRETRLRKQQKQGGRGSKGGSKGGRGEVGRKKKTTETAKETKEAPRRSIRNKKT